MGTSRGEGTPQGYSVGPTTEDKELRTGGRLNDEGDELRWAMGPRAAPPWPWAEPVGGCTDNNPPPKKSSSSE